MAEKAKPIKRYCPTCKTDTSPATHYVNECAQCGRLYDKTVAEPVTEIQQMQLMDVTFAVGKGIKSIKVDGANEKVTLSIPVADLSSDFIDSIKDFVGDDLIDVAITKLQRLSVLRTLMDSQR